MRTVPSWAWLVAAGLYVICPLDLDFIPVIGWIDDVIVAYLGIQQWKAANQVAAPKTDLVVRRKQTP